MSQEELLLEQWRYLPTHEQTSVINFIEFLRYRKSGEVQEDVDYDGPEHLKVRSTISMNSFRKDWIVSIEKNGSKPPTTSGNKSVRSFCQRELFNPFTPSGGAITYRMKNNRLALEALPQASTQQTLF